MTDRALAVVLADVAEGVQDAQLGQLVRLLLSTPSPWGQERTAAEAVARWIAATYPTVRVAVDLLCDDRANLLVDAGDGPRQLLICSHLDTTFSGYPQRDEVLTGRDDPPAGHVTDGGVLVGPGLAVARGPAAAATVGYLAAVAALGRSGRPHHTSLLLAAGGTHHRRSAVGGDNSPAQFGVGVRHALAHGLVPDAVVMAKAGPPTILHEEPGSAYVDIELRGRLLPAMSRTDDDGGLIAHLPTVIDAFEQWRAAFVARDLLSVRLGREAAIGAISTGSPGKCDVLPAVARLSAYLVLGHGDVAEELAADLARTIGSALPPNGGVVASATVGTWNRAGHTPADAPVVLATKTATGLDTVIAGWRGSTDGVVFRSAGIDTVRWGPTVTADPDDPRCDRLQLGDLVAAARTYAQIVVHYTLTHR